jgi:hypothetical protein
VSKYILKRADPELPIFIPIFSTTCLSIYFSKNCINIAG